MSEKNKPVKDPRSLNIHGVPEKLRSKFHAACIEKGTNMKEAIIAFMRSYTGEPYDQAGRTPVRE